MSAVEELLISSSSVASTSGFTDSFLRSLAVIIVTEIGDKTFFIAAILCMKYGRLTVYLGAMAALTVMHLLSSFMGYTLPTLIPRFYTHYISAVTYLYKSFLNGCSLFAFNCSLLVSICVLRSEASL